MTVYGVDAKKVAKQEVRKPAKTTLKPKLNEKQIQSQIVHYLRQTGWVVFETNQPGLSHATPGLPDLICIKDSIRRRRRVLWCECKGPKGKQSPAQIQAQQDIESQGGEYLLANSLDVVMDYLKT